MPTDSSAATSELGSRLSRGLPPRSFFPGAGRASSVASAPIKSGLTMETSLFSSEVLPEPYEPNGRFSIVALALLTNGEANDDVADCSDAASAKLDVSAGCSVDDND